MKEFKTPTSSQCIRFTIEKSIYFFLFIIDYYSTSILIGSKKVIRRGTEWEIVEGLKDGQRYDKKPELFRGYLHKKRKWPLKGWHKVCGFVLLKS